MEALIQELKNLYLSYYTQYEEKNGYYEDIEEYGSNEYVGGMRDGIDEAIKLLLSHQSSLAVTNLEPEECNLNKEDQDFINNLSNEMKTQNNRCTASPYGLVIGKKVRVVTDYENCSNKAIYWSETDYDSFEEFMESLEEYYLEDSDQSDIVDYIRDNCDDIDELRCYEHEIADLMMESFSVYGYNIEDTACSISNSFTGNFFITDKAAKAYVERNKHNIGSSAFTYGVHLYRNPEMERLYEIIHKLAK